MSLTAEPSKDRGECNPHPDAPHGFDRNASHTLGEYVCDCESWYPEEPMHHNVIPGGDGYAYAGFFHPDTGELVRV